MRAREHDRRLLPRLAETYRGTISRGVTLAHEIDDKATVAKLEDGVLKLTLPKRSGASSKLIPVT